MHVVRLGQDDAGLRLDPQPHPVRAVIYGTGPPVLLEHELPQGGNGPFVGGGHRGGYYRLQMSWVARFVRGGAARLPGGGRLGGELEQSRRQRDLLHQRLDRSERQRQVLRRLLETRRQRSRAAQPDAAVLEHVLPLRHAAMLAANHDGRSGRERAFAGRSASYREALAHPDAAMPLAAEQVVINGLRWWMPAQRGDSGGIAGGLAGRRRLPVREILETRELAVGRVMIDIGANVGTTSIPRVLLGDFNCIYAIEPDPGNYACLVRNIADNGVRGLVLPDRVALCGTNGQMNLRTLHSGTHHLVMRGSGAGEHERVSVPCVTLDRWVAQIGIDLADVAFIKSDTQA